MELSLPASELNGAALSGAIDGIEHERLLIVRGVRSGLTITVAVHDTRLGPALGGCRVWHYRNWSEAVADALRLSRAMTYKNATAGLNHGGGKCVIYLPEGTVLNADRRRAAMLDLGDAVESLAGSYQTAEDVGTTAADMAVVAERTSHVCGLPSESGGVGEPSDPTSIGVYASLLATLDEAFGHRDVAGRRVTVAGLGQVGSRLATRLAADGAALTVTDVNPAKRALATSLGATWVEPEEAHRVPADVFMPAGVGGVLTAEVIDGLSCSAVVGPANNQLAEPDGAAQLAARGILWAPDFVVNAGGVIYLARMSGGGGDLAETMRAVEGIGETVTAVFRTAREGGLTTLQAAERLAQDRLDAAQPVVER